MPIEPFIRLADRFGPAALVVVSDTGQAITIPVTDHTLARLAHEALGALLLRLPAAIDPGATR